MDSHTFAPRRVHFITAFVAALFSALALALIVGPSQAVGKVLVIPALIASLVAIGRSFRIALVVSESGVTVKNYWRTYRFTWEAVRRVAIREGSGVWAVGPSPVVAFFLLSGSRPVEAHATRWLGNQEQKDRLVYLVSSLAPREAVVDLSAAPLK